MRKNKRVIATLKPYADLEWLKDLERLIAKYSGLGVENDIATMSVPELWGLHQWLSSLQES